MFFLAVPSVTKSFLYRSRNWSGLPEKSFQFHGTKLILTVELVNISLLIVVPEVDNGYDAGIPENVESFHGLSYVTLA